MAEILMEGEEGPTFFERLRARFTHSEVDEAPTYERKLLDGRIERFLDENFNNYLEEYNLVTELDLRVYDERFDELMGQVRSLTEFSHTVDADVSALEHRLAAVSAKAAALDAEHGKTTTTIVRTVKAK